MHLCLVTEKAAATAKCDIGHLSLNWLFLHPTIQAGSFQNLQTLVEVSSILAAQGVYTNPEQPSEKEELVRQTILTEQPVQQQEQAYQQPLEPAAR